MIAVIHLSLIGDYNLQLASVLPAAATAAFPQRLIELFKSLVPINDATIVVYPANRLPVIDYFQPRADGRSFLDQFVNAAFLLDPFYQAAAKDGAFGFFRLRGLAPEGFRNSEYYRTFYAQSGYQDECGYLVATGGQGFVNISLARTSKPVLFSKMQLALLTDIAPVVEILCRQHWGGAAGQGNGETNLRTRLQAALDAFGSSLLTAREASVINLILHGYSTRMAAEKLGVSVETVKLHRKHSYAKLEIGSQAELFYLFLDSLMNARGYTDGDTLEDYLRRPQGNGVG